MQTVYAHPFFVVRTKAHPQILRTELNFILLPVINKQHKPKVMQNENKLNTFSINQSKEKIIAKQAQGDCEGTDFVFVSACSHLLLLKLYFLFSNI